MKRLFIIAASTVLLAACGEIDQSASSDRYFPDAHPYKGAKNAFVEAGWTPGDKTSWQNQLRERGQYQNEYVKTN